VSNGSARLEQSCRCKDQQADGRGGVGSSNQQHRTASADTGTPKRGSPSWSLWI